MSWLSGLYETYESNQALLYRKDGPLLPICHTTQQAHIEIVLNGKGEFVRAYVVPRDENTTVIPCTEQSASRSGIKPANHPLCDKLQYVAGDFSEFGGVVTKGFRKDPKEPYMTYLRGLMDWAESPYGHPKIDAILKYVEKGSVVRDLVNYGILHTDSQGRLLGKWTSEEEPPEIFSVIPSSQAQYDAFVRWSVEIPNMPESSVWQDETLFQSWTDFYTSLQSDRDICYVTGEEVAIALSHPAKIRNEGDKAKLISANDNSGYTFRGMFDEATQAVSVGFEVTQKAHNMLRWLVQHQGFRSGNLAVVAWASGGATIPNPVYDSPAFMGSPDEPEISYTAEEFALKLKNKILGFQQELGEFSDIFVIGLDSATPGRMSISFYRELWSSAFLRRIEDWHYTCSWQHSYRSGVWKGKRGIQKEYVGAPSLYDITEAAYGARVDSKLRTRTIERLLPCVIDGQPLPTDIVNAAVRRACNRSTFAETWEWKKALTIACALYKKANIKEGYTLALDKKRTSRDYLYGRLLAFADNLESWALMESGEQRPTNAARMMNRFAERPFSTWKTLELALTPYKVRLGPKKSYRLEKGISEVMDLFEPEDFTNDRPLSGEFLLGYHCQMMAFWNKTDEK